MPKRPAPAELQHAFRAMGSPCRIRLAGRCAQRLGAGRAVQAAQA